MPGKALSLGTCILKGPVFLSDPAPIGPQSPFLGTEVLGCESSLWDPLLFLGQLPLFSPPFRQKDCSGRWGQAGCWRHGGPGAVVTGMEAQLL